MHHRLAAICRGFGGDISQAGADRCAAAAAAAISHQALVRQSSFRHRVKCKSRAVPQPSRCSCFRNLYDLRTPLSFSKKNTRFDCSSNKSSSSFSKERSSSSFSKERSSSSFSKERSSSSSFNKERSSSSFNNERSSSSFNNERSSSGCYSSMAAVAV
ncbi:hypothetical protein FHG87_003156 [Trinorchestia longiramus]|nr:hypothetical protein FHG87_003156 [Trinorchestia longiramus]